MLTEKFTLRLDPETREELRRLANLNKRTESDMIRQLIHEEYEGKEQNNKRGG